MDESLESNASISDEFKAGARVRIHGLQSAEGANLNGRCGRCVGFDLATGRWGVKLLDDTSKKVKPTNLSLVGDSIAAPAYACIAEKRKLLASVGNASAKDADDAVVQAMWMSMSKPLLAESSMCAKEKKIILKTWGTDAVEDMDDDTINAVWMSLATLPLCDASIPVEPVEANDVGSSRLRHWFDTCYAEGGVFNVTGFEHEPQDRVFIHLLSGMKVWDSVLDLRHGDGGASTVVFHYTSDLGFRNITAFQKSSVEIWASLVTEKEPDGTDNRNAWWGKGVYGTARGPDDFGNCDAVVDNNFRRMLKRDIAKREEELRVDLSELDLSALKEQARQQNVSDEAIEQAQKADDPARAFRDLLAEVAKMAVLNHYRSRVHYCIPLLVSREDAYDVAVRETPEMRMHGFGLGRNLKGDSLNEDGKPLRDQWVIQVKNEEGIVDNARAMLLSTLRERVGRMRERRGNDDIEVLKAEVLLAEVLREQGCLLEAEAVGRHCSQGFDFFFGMEHQLTLSALNNLSSTLADSGKLMEAEDMQRRVWQSRERKHGSQSKEAIRSMNNLAQILSQLGRMGEALPLKRRALQGFAKVSGMEHEDTLCVLGNLGATLLEMGQAQEAVPMLRSVMEAFEKHHGKDHPTTLKAQGNLAEALRKLAKVQQTFGSQQNLQEAERLGRRRLDVSESTLGQNHPDTLEALNNHGLTLVALGRAAEAEPLQRRAVEGSELRDKGKTNLTTLQMQINYASTLKQIGQQEDALRMERSSLKSCEKLFGDEHPTTLTVVNNLAMSLYRRGELREAVDLFRRCANGLARVLGPSHPQTISCKNSLQVAESELLR